jgi:formylglycine-generating enzyme required for sulfatase activity
VPLRLFISYSHKDKPQLDELLEGLRPLERDGLIEPWTDRLIDTGEDWRKKIATATNDCDLGLFLLSKPFLGSDFIESAELKPLLARAKSGEVHLLPILLRECDWENSALKYLQPLPGYHEYIETPNADQASRDKAWTRVVLDIRQRAEKYRDQHETIQWPGSPYPGLRAFDEREASIFTGRAEQTKALIDKLTQGTRLLAVYGASGSGKSSLVRAGLIPAWRQRFSPSKDTPVLIIKPNEYADGDPFTPLATKLSPHLGPEWDLSRLKQALQDHPASIVDHLDDALRDQPDAVELLLVVDQFEELFTTVKSEFGQSFAELLTHFCMHPHARAVLTVRSDFFHCFADYSGLSDKLNADNGHFLVAPLGPEHLRALMEKPARLAGFHFEDGLINQMLAEAETGGSKEGLVPLLQFALAKLYEPFAQRVKNNQALPTAERVFTKAAYNAFSGIKGAVGSAAQAALSEVEQECRDASAALPRLFRALVTVRGDQKPTRQRASRAELENDPVCAKLVQRLVGDKDHARLLVAQEDHVEVAHEILFDAWENMAKWITTFKYDLQQRDRMVFEAQQWHVGGCSDRHLLWSHERQQALYESLKNLGQPRETWNEDPVRSFLRPEAERLLDEIDDPNTDHARRDWIGARWASIDDPRRGVGLDPESGLPDILWSQAVPPGRVELEDDAGSFTIDAPFQLAVHLITRDQYRAFLDASDGYDNDAWWDGIARPNVRWPPTGAGGNYPVGLVEWNEAVAYCRWLDHRFRALDRLGRDQQIRLPTEWEWQWAASGRAGQDYPWSGSFDPMKLNSVESGLMRNTAVGLYPEGKANCGALDLAGNSWEWCLNKYDNAFETSVGGQDKRVLRGGSWIDVQNDCRAAYRVRFAPDGRDNYIGFRLCLSSPIVNY